MIDWRRELNLNLAVDRQLDSSKDRSPVITDIAEP